jgi:PHP family Zn ribbon phosphoesterase
VDNRVFELQDIESGVEVEIEKAKKVYEVLPLHEILSSVLGVGVNTKKVWTEYYKLIEKFENEFAVLLEIGEEKLLQVVSKEIVDIIMMNRQGKIRVKPGYDGVYGEAMLDVDGGEDSEEKQEELF